MHFETLGFDQQIAALLVASGLSVSDLAGHPALELRGIRIDGVLAGVVGIEIHGRLGLLRSLAVTAAHRQAGLGASLVSEAESVAAERGVETLYLLTTTASSFFAGLGYEELARSEAPAAIAATAQFSSLCPASSTFMYKTLRQSAVDGR